MTPIDLHCHSFFSDGRLAPEELISRAKSNGCELLALTDHDTIEGIPRAKLAAAKENLRLIPGIELSALWGKEVVHIVGLNFNPESPALSAYLEGLRGVRRRRLKLIAAKLEKRGIEGAEAGALALAANPDAVGRLHIARYLVETGVVKSTAEAFRKYLGTGKIGDIKIAWPTVDEAVQMLRAAGGVAVAAHPFRYGWTLTKIRRFLTDFKAAGGEAMEVVSGNPTKGEIHTAGRLAGEFNLFASAGSDFHGAEFERRDVGRAAVLPPGVTPVWDSF